MWSGLHAPNTSLVDEDYEIVSIMQPLTMKLLDIEGCENSALEHRALYNLGVHHYTVRLRDCRANGIVQSDEDYAQHLFEQIQKWHARGVLWYQIDNEPNWQFLTRDFGPFDYVWYMKRVIKRLRLKLADASIIGIMLIAPPLSFSPAQWNHNPDNVPSAHTLDEWRAAFKFTNKNGDEFDQRTFYSYFNYAGANVYWQYPRQFMDGSYGFLYRLVAQDSNLPVVILEWSCSLHEVYHKVNSAPVRTYSDEEVEGIRVAEYPEWVRWANIFGAAASYCWIVGGTEDWRGYRLTHEIAQAMSQRKIPEYNTRNLGSGRFEI